MQLTTFASLTLGFGFLNGLRTLTPVAVLCWGTRLGWLPLGQTPFSFLTHPVSLGVFTALAAGELIGDKLPKTPPRTDAFPLLARCGFGAGVGTVLASVAGRPLWLGGLLGGVAAIAGAFAGFYARRALTKGAGLPDLPVALAEDALAIGGAFLIVSRF